MESQKDMSGGGRGLYAAIVILMVTEVLFFIDLEAKDLIHNSYVMHAVTVFLIEIPFILLSTLVSWKGVRSMWSLIMALYAIFRSGYGLYVNSINTNLDVLRIVQSLSCLFIIFWFSGNRFQWRNRRSE